jgi:hypothetical protein
MALDKNRLTEKYVFTKYADVDADAYKESIASHIKQAIINASHIPSHGIINFTKLLEADHASLGLTIVKNNTFQHNSLVVFPAVANPDTFTSHYAGLSSQVESYLTRYPQLFPTHIGGEPVSYDNFKIDLVFGV